MVWLTARAPFRTAEFSGSKKIQIRDRAPGENGCWDRFQKQLNLPRIRGKGHEELILKRREESAEKALTKRRGQEYKVMETGYRNRLHRENTHNSEVFQSPQRFPAVTFRRQ
jgi:hypothetical protein